MGESAYTQLCGPVATQDHFDHLPSTVSQDLMHPRLNLFPRVVKDRRGNRTHTPQDRRAARATFGR